MLRASDEATSGSVMEKQDRISPSSSGYSHCSFCSSVPNMWRISMFPVSGAEQFKASGARTGLRPVISASGAYSCTARPAPSCSSGRKRFHRPRLLALALSSSTMGGWWLGSPASAICSSYTGSAG